MCDHNSLPVDWVYEEEMLLVLSDQNHRKNTAVAFKKPLEEVTNGDLIQHFYDSGWAEQIATERRARSSVH
jgi:hypothetical protein